MSNWLQSALSATALLNCASVALAAVTISDGKITDQPVRGNKNIREASVVVARTWMSASDLLVAAHDQCALIYAIALPEYQTPVGPFKPGDAVRIDALAKRIGDTLGVAPQWINHVLVFAPASATSPAASAVQSAPSVNAESSTTSQDASGTQLTRVSALDAQGGLDAAVELSKLAGSQFGEVRLYAMAAMERMEPEFMINTTRGRVSILEVIADRLDRDALLYALEEGGPVGGRQWKLAVELLGRSRERLIARHLWNPVWMLKPGTVRLGIWGLGRCGDGTGIWAMRGRMRKTDTNDTSDFYLAGMAMGQVNGFEYLERDYKSTDVNLQRVVAFGLGFTTKFRPRAIKLLSDYLSHDDAAVQFLACQSLARLADPESDAKLAAVISDKTSGPALRAAAMDALANLGRPNAGALIAPLLADQSPVVRAQAATLLGITGGGAATAQLLPVLKDEDRNVRSAAIAAIARIGTAQGLALAAAVAKNPEADSDERIAALLGLGHSLAPEAAAALTDVVNDTDSHARIRRYATLGLGRLAQGAGNTTLAQLASLKSSNPLSLAARFLNLGNPEKTTQLLVPLLTHAERGMACAAAGALAELGYAPATLELLEGSGILDNHTRKMHNWGAVRSQGREVTLALASAAGSRRRVIRHMAALALDGRLHPEAGDALWKLLQDENHRVRHAAATSLTLLPDPRCIPLLAELALNDPETSVARKAAEVLRGRDFRDLPEARKALDAINNMAQDPGGSVRTPPPLATQPDNSFVLRAQAEHIEEDLVCNLTYESSLCYDSHNGRVVQWGAHGRRYDTPQMGETWFYDTGANRWSRLTGSRHIPNGTCCIRGTMFDRANKVVISPRSGGGNGHGWHNALRSRLSESRTWVLDVTTDQWYAAAPFKSETGGFMPGSFDPVNGVVMWWKGYMMAYDAYDNTWTRFQSVPGAPKYPGNTGGVFDPQTGLFIAVADKSTWSFDPTKNIWTDLQPQGPQPPAAPMVYDSANDVMLVFRNKDDATGVWVYHIRDNRWEELPATYPGPANGTLVDAAYDERNNVTVISGSHISGYSSTPNSRQTWTYRYRTPEKTAPALGSPDATCVVAQDGGVTISWKPISGVKSYRIERGVGAHPWEAAWETAGEAGADATEFHDKGRDKTLSFYRVIAIGQNNEPAAPGLPARTAPRIVRQVYAMANSAGNIQLSWQPSPNTDIIGYHLYRAPVEITAYWSKTFNPGSVAGKLDKITLQPVKETSFIDTEVKVQGTANELEWPATYAYVVRPVNAWGVEGGASPITLALPDPPGPMESIPWADGRRLVLWNAPLAGSTPGYSLMRMDDWDARHVFRLHAAPVPTAGCWDGDNYPTGDRRVYHVSALDRLGAIGVPTSPHWSHGFP